MTLTLPDGAPSSAWRTLTAALARLRRRRFWRAAVAGGFQRIELKRARNGYGWNLHAHLLVELRPGHALSPDDVAAAWTELLVRSGRVGSSHVRAVYRLWDRAP